MGQIARFVFSSLLVQMAPFLSFTIFLYGNTNKTAKPPKRVNTIARGILDVTGRSNATVPTNVASKNSDAPSNAAAVPAMSGKGSKAPPAPAPIIKAPLMPANAVGTRKLNKLVPRNTVHSSMITPLKQKNTLPNKATLVTPNMILSLPAMMLPTKNVIPMIAK